MKVATRGSNAWWQQCGCLCVCVCVGEIKDMTWGNDANFHLFVFFSKVVLMGPSTFKNRAFLMEKRAEGKEKKSESVQRLEESPLW